LDIARNRLLNQLISAKPLRTPEEVVDWLVAVQAQDYAGAKWALGLRLLGCTDKDIEKAFSEGSILRTHLMRPTWHFVTPADIRWLLMLTAPRVHAVNGTLYRRLGLDNSTLKHSHAILAKALVGGNQLTRNELRDTLQQAGITIKNGLHLAYILMAAELDGLICSGVRCGKQFTYGLLDERVPQAEFMERDAALAELARRYFVSRGPATVHDFAKWSGLTVADARLGLEAVKAALVHEVVGENDYWFSPVIPAASEVSSRAYLLSIYDEYISGYKDRSAIGEAEVGGRLISLGNALSYIVVLDGQIVGTWKRTLSKDVGVIQLDLFYKLTEDDHQAIAAAAQRYGEFLELPVILS
jgi:hypothetical protein